MTSYSLILFLHIVSAFGILVSFALEWKGLSVLQRSCSFQETRNALKEFNILPRIGGPSYLVSLLSGIYLWEEAWRGSAWTVIALISLVVLAAIGAILTGPRMGALGKMVAGEPANEAGAVQLQMPVLWASLQVRTWMVIGIAFLMSVKPGAVGSVITMIVAIVIGLVVNQAMKSYYRSHAVCGATIRWE